MDMVKLRAWWFHRQGLDGRLTGGSSAEALEQTGWSRSVGGANPYLALMARTGATREQIDLAVSNGEIHELPSARGCTYVVPRSQFALALKVSQGFGDEATINNAIKHLGVTSDEIDRLAESVVNLLKNGPLDPKQMKDHLGNQIRSFGEEGKKRGITTDLPMALGRLQTKGKIRRIPLNGRLDNQRYAYQLWTPSPLAGSNLSKEEAMAQLAQSYFGWIGAASVKNFQWFSGLGVKASQEVINSLALKPLQPGSDLLATQEAIDDFHSFETPNDPRYALTGSIDNLSHLRLGLRDHIDESDVDRVIPSEKGLVEVGGISELVSHAIYDRGRLIGVWEFDPEAGEIIHQTWAKPDHDLKALISRLSSEVKEHLGDARTFSLDSPESRKPRLAMLRGT